MKRLATALVLFWCALLVQVEAGTNTPPSDEVSFQTRSLTFGITPETGGFRIKDPTGLFWWSNPYAMRFGQATFNVDGKTQQLPLRRCEVTRLAEGLEALFQPLPGKSNVWVKVTIRPLADPKTIEFSYVAGDGLESIRLLDNALWVDGASKGYLVVPVREGLLIPADSGVEFTHSFDTYAYEGCHMEMFGVVNRRSAALVTWDDPYVDLEVRSVRTNALIVHGSQVLSPSLILRKSAKAFRVQFLGEGDYVSIAKAYREIARQKGWYVPWEEKLKGHPERSKLFGAINFKLWSALDRRMDEASAKEERVRVNWTFEEAAQVAEHLKNDLHLDKVLFTVGGWIHRGYDNQHPDILPAAPECGGDAGLAECARRVQKAGYMFCLHDNYQDIYRDSPSWNEDLIMKHRDGSLVRGGHWAGGLAFLTCSQKALELAERPQNLPAVKELCHPDAYFIDTTYAAGLQECYDPKHPLTRADDMHWKQALSDYARGLFGIFGSECGREWAIGHSDFFEGLTGVSGHAYHNEKLLAEVGGVVVPLFELVYRDCIAMYGKYGYDLANSTGYVLDHISIGRPLNYHAVPPHLYWNNTNPMNQAELTNSGAIFMRAQHGWAEGLHPLDRFVKNTAEILSPLNELTARLPMTTHEFLSADRQVQRTVFGSGRDAVEVVVNKSARPYGRNTRAYGEVILPPNGFVVESPTFVAFLASKWNGIGYQSPSMFTARSLDAKPLAKASGVRVYHGFGEARLRIGGREVEIQREAVVTRRGKQDR